MGDMIETKWHVGEDNAYQTCKHLVDGAGKIPKIPLYRGISIEDYENICQCGKSLAAYTLSFTPSKDVAMSFANSSGNVIEVYSKDVRMFDTYEFGTNFELAWAATESNSTDEMDDWLDRGKFDYAYIENPEFEWICMRDVEFVPINKEKTKFYVVKQRRLNERMCNGHTRRQIQEAIAYWTKVLNESEEDEQDAQQWLVDFSDDEDGKQTAAFSSKQDASTWIRNREMQDRYDPTGFEVLKGPYRG